METNSFKLNNIFEKNAKVYQTKPVRATKYQPGMETGWVVYMQNEPKGDLENNLHEGMKFFDTEQEAWDYINADHKQYINKNGVPTEIAVVYEAPMPVLHRKETDPEKKVGYMCCIKSLIIFAMASFYFSIVTRRKRADFPVFNSMLEQFFFKKG